MTNISNQPCVRDLDSARQEIVVWSPDGQRLWSSNDCVNGSTPDLRTLVPGPAGRVRGDLGRAHLDARLRAAPAPSCRPATTVCMTRVDDVISPSRRLPAAGLTWAERP